MKIINSIWFTPMPPQPIIGIVIVDFEEGEGERAFIGCGRGLNRGDDETLIAERGSKFPLKVAQKIMEKGNWS